MKYYLKCINCGRELEANPRASTCPDCGPFKGTLDVIYPLEELSERYGKGISGLSGKNIFDTFSDIFPFEHVGNLPPLSVGGTPYFQSPNLAELTGMNHLWFKDDGRNPSASLKDRASAVAIAMARESGADIIAVASTGNAASSLATLAAAVCMKAVLFVPGNVPQPKLVQIMIHGARILRLDCDYDTAFDLCQQACDRFGWYNRNTAVNPFTGEGKKSVALEIALDLGEAPDGVVCPVGDGCILGALYKGFADLKGLGLIDKLPRLFGVQAENADPLVKAIFLKREIEPQKDVKTIADSIAVGYPRDGHKALRAVKNTGGAIISVSDKEILSAQSTLASKGGIFAEPAASASYAGLTRLIENNQVDINEKIVVLLTGHGLKDIDTARGNVGSETDLIKPDIETIEKQLDSIK